MLALAVLLAVAAGRLAAWRVADPYSRYYTRKVVRYLVGLVAIAVTVRPASPRARPLPAPSGAPTQQCPAGDVAVP